MVHDSSSREQPCGSDSPSRAEQRHPNHLDISQQSKRPRWEDMEDVQSQLAEVRAALEAERAKRLALEDECTSAHERAQHLNQERQKYRERLREAHTAFANLKSSFLRQRVELEMMQHADRTSLSIPNAPTIPRSPPPLASVKTEEEVFHGFIPPTEGLEQWPRVNNNNGPLASQPGPPLPMPLPTVAAVDQGACPTQRPPRNDNNTIDAVGVSNTPSNTIPESGGPPPQENWLNGQSTDPDLIETAIPPLPPAQTVGPAGGTTLEIAQCPAAVVQISKWKTAVRNFGFEDDLRIKRSSKATTPAHDADDLMMPPPPRKPAQQTPHQGRHVQKGPARVNNENGDGTGFRYQEVVRQREARSKLPAFDCHDCKRFYQALEKCGSLDAALAAGMPMPRCGHEKNSTEQQDNVGGGNLGADLLAAASRHRFQNPPPLTPNGYWDIAFTSE